MCLTAGGLGLVAAPPCLAYGSGPSTKGRRHACFRHHSTEEEKTDKSRDRHRTGPIVVLQGKEVEAGER